MKLPKWAWILLAVVVGLPVSFVLIGILAGLLLPATSGALARSNEVHAERTAFSLKDAIAAFHAEYRDYPILDPARDHTVDSGHALMDILLGSDMQKGPGGRNPRGIAFYTDKAAKPMGEGRFRKGLTLDAHGGGELWDP